MQYLYPLLVALALLGAPRRDDTLAWLISQPTHADGHGHAIPRPYGAALTIADVCADEPDPRICAITLDTLASHESAYRTAAVGDHGQSCGAYQTPCARTPPDGLGQTRLALRILKQAETACPEHPIRAYASGACKSSPVAVRYEREIAIATQASHWPLPNPLRHNAPYAP